MGKGVCVAREGRNQWGFTQPGTLRACPPVMESTPIVTAPARRVQVGAPTAGEAALPHSGSVEGSAGYSQQ